MSSKKQTGMVFHQATTTAATPAADHPTMCFVVPKPGKASEARMEQATCVIDEEADMMGKPNMCLSKEAIKTSDGLTALKHLTSTNTQLDILSPYSTCKGIRVTLDNNSMWNEFFRCRTEMILTKQGSRMFPYCRFRISGLQPSRKYSLIMDIQPLDNCGYKWTGKSWQVAGKAEGHVKSQPFAHPESPSTGQHWMQNPVSFYKLKLTNNISDEENTILHPMHRYLPRLHVVQTDKAAKDIKLNGPSVVTFTFPQTEFMAVTAYQNTQFAQLKVDYNPFAKGLKEDVSNSWGLKLKLNSGKDLHKDGDTTNSKQHPVKKNLKSLLANHKPRSSKVAYSNPLVSVDLQKDSTINKDQSDAKVPEESLCNSSSRPAQKLFSELIREAHVSLHRCNLEQLSIDNSTELINTKTTALNSKKDVRHKDGTCDKAHSKRSSVKRSETPLTKRKSKGRKGILNSPDSKDNVRTDSSEVGNVAAPVVDSDHPPKPEAQSEVSVKQHKRPAPLPLPALALFLKQHSTKSKKVKNKSDSPPTRLPSQTLSGSQSPAAAAEPQSPGHSSSGASGIIKSDSETSGPPANIDSGEMVLNVTGHEGETAFQPSSPACLDTVLTPEPKFARTDDCLNPISVAESSAAPDVTLGLPDSDQPYCSLGTSTSTISSTLATSSSSPVLSRSLDIVLPVPNSPQMTVTESSTLPSDPPTIKSHGLLPDSECCSFSFVPLSPACSPEPLPPLPDSLALDLNCSTSEPTPKGITTEDLPQSEHSAASVFKWHTVLPPSEPYIDDSFATFQSTSQTLPLTSITSPLLPSPTASQPEPQSIDTSTETPPPGPPPPFQENEQSLPFPAELSPLALQLPLSPTFSSLDGDGLSPPPSIADLVHFFSTDEDLGMGVDFPNTDAVAVACPPPTTAEANALEPSQEVQPAQPSKPCKRKSRRRRLPETPVDQKTDDSTYIRMQPNLEEVEEQLFISFTSKEALKLHIADASEETVTQPQTTNEGHPTQPQMTPGHLIEPQTTPEGHLTQSTDAPENAESLEQKISTCETILFRDLKLMKHRQVIHPVLQEVGLKMNLLDSTLAIDLQYLGVRLPIPSPGESLEPLTQELLPTQGATSVFVSRTGKTTDMTQIKGWRDKFNPPEAPLTSSSAGPEAGLSLDVQKKNLSAFCSDMLDEYLENEGKLIDERAASFSQPLVEPLVYELPTRSSSYVRTLDSVLKKHDVGSPTSDLISGFVPPSKRPKLSLKEMKISRKGEKKQRGPKQTRFRIEPAVAPVPAPEPGPADPNVVPTQPAVLTPGPAPSKLTRLLSEHQKSRRKQLKLRPDHSEPLTLSAFNPAFKRRRKLKMKTLSQTLSVPRSMEPPQDITEDLAPLESDSELGDGADQGVDAHKDRGTAMTRALLRQKDLEDGVVWEGRSRTSITEERAAIALTSLFTLMGFVSENPTAPIQLVRRRAPPCLNECCRLGCVCSSLSHLSRVSHCGRPSCMFGCSCLKQKVVLLKNLDGSDSSPSHHGNTQKRRRRRRRMKMAYILKEADSVSQPAERVRVLWRRNGEDPDPEPIHVPETATPTSRESNSSCARVRGFRGKRRSQKQQMRAGQQVDSKNKSKRVCLKSLSHTERILKYKATPTSVPQADEPPPNPPIPDPSSSPLPMNPAPKPSKRLIILAECKWASDGDRNHVLKRLCEAMAQDRLDGPFWIRKYLISPLSQTVEQSGADRCIQYKIHISRPQVEREGAAAAARPRPGVQKKKPEPPQGGGVEVCPQVSQVKKEAEGWQQEGAEPLEDWQREVDDVDIQEEEGSTPHQPHDGTGRRRWKNRTEAERGEKKKKRRMVTMALPFLIGISPAGFLSANRKQPGGTDHLVQVNGKLYPLAKVQLGRMGALHPANRLAAYLTGRVGSNRKPQGSSSSCQPAEIQNSGPPSTAPSTPDLNDPTTTKPTRPITVVTLPTSATDSQVSRSVFQPVDPSPGPVAPEGSQLMSQAPPPRVNVPVLSRSGPHPGAPPPSAGQRVLLQLVQTSSGMQCYRRADGKLVQLIPISHLRPGGGTSVTVSPSVVTVNQAPLTSGDRSSSSFLSVPPLPGPRSPTSAILSQKGLSTLKILPPSTKEPIFISCPSPSPRRVLKVGGSICLPPRVAPVKLISLAPSVGQGAELGVKTVVMSAVPKKPATLQTLPTSQSPTHTVLPPLQPTGSEVTTVPPPHTPTEPELARDLVDLDIICVDDENEPVNTETRSSEVVDLLGSSSGETDNSSDFEDESSSEEETTRCGDTNEHVQRDLHNQLERKRRGRMLQLFDALRREVGLSLHKTSKISTLNKAVQVIQDLRVTESGLQKRKRRLMKRREKFLSTLAPPSEKRESRDKTGPGPGPDPGPDPGPEVLDLSDELTEDSHLEEGEEPYIVSMETSQLDAAQRRMKSKEVDNSSSSETSPLQQVRGSDITLQTEEQRPKTLLTQQKDSGRSEQSVLRKLQQEERLHETHKGGGSSVTTPAVGGASDTPTKDRADEDVQIMSSYLLLPQAPPTPVSTPPTSTAVHQSQKVMLMSKSVPPPLPAVSHHAPVTRERTRTIPNILSRSKIPAAASLHSEGEAQPLRALVPTEVLSLVGTALPGRPVMTLSPLMSGSTVLQPSSSPGMAAVTLNIPSLVNQKIHLTPQPCPPIGNIYSSSAPFTVTNLSASNLNHVLHLVHPATQQQQLPQQQHQQQTAPPSQSDPDQTNVRPVPSPPAPSLRTGGDGQVGVSGGGAKGAESESLSSLLNEIVFLNQQTVPTATAAKVLSVTDTAVGGAKEQSHAHIPQVSDCTSATETEEVGLQGPEEATQTGPQPGPPNDNTKDGNLAPPPLLQMKVGGVKVAAPTNSGTAVTAGRSGAQVKGEGGVAWRPMPRLVPLGLRGNPPS